MLNLLTKMQVGVCEDDIRGSFQLGRWTIGGDARPVANPRLLLVQLTEQQKI